MHALSYSGSTLILSILSINSPTPKPLNFSKLSSWFLMKVFSFVQKGIFANHIDRK